MDIWVLNKNFEKVACVDTYTSFIWTDRFWEAGDFELYIPMSEEAVNIFQMDYYLRIDQSEHVMIVEKLVSSSDPEEGDNLIISGRSAESILSRRIIWNQTEIKNKSANGLQNGIKTLINDNIISPALMPRKISNFIFQESTRPEITELELEAQYTGDNLYEVICDLCQENKIGFKITLDDDNNWIFELYPGDDRSYYQNDNPFIVFSPNFENIINSEYAEDKTEYCNVTLVAGEGEGASRKTFVAGDSGSSGVDRRELFTDARELSTDGESGTIPLADYNQQLAQKGLDELKEYKVDKTFDGEVETSKTFVYDLDYKLGDVVELENAYGQKNRTRVIEFIRNQDDEGYSAYPTFDVVQGEEKTYPSHPMTSVIDECSIWSSSDYSSNYAPWKACNWQVESENNAWASANGASLPQWWRIKVPKPMKNIQVSITNRNSDYGGDIANGGIEISPDDGVTWVPMYSFSNRTGQKLVTTTYNLENTEAYQHVLIRALSVWNEGKTEIVTNHYASIGQVSITGEIKWR